MPEDEDETVSVELCARPTASKERSPRSVRRCVVIELSGEETDAHRRFEINELRIVEDSVSSADCRQ